MLENSSRAVTGQCKGCGSDVYRILGKSEQSVKIAAPALVKAPARIARRSSDTPSMTATWSYVAAAGVIIGIIAAFFVYAVL